jgi:hypothetical protein
LSRGKTSQTVTRDAARTNLSMEQQTHTHRSRVGLQRGKTSCSANTFVEPICKSSQCQSQERARLNIALIMTATITATSAIQRTAASIEPNISAATRTATATTAIAIPTISSLNRCQKVKGGDVPGGPMGGREEITICILRFISPTIIWRLQHRIRALLWRECSIHLGRFGLRHIPNNVKAQARPARTTTWSGFTRHPDKCASVG